MFVPWITGIADEIICFTEIIFQDQFMFVFINQYNLKGFFRKRIGKNNLSKIYTVSSKEHLKILYFLLLCLKK